MKLLNLSYEYLYNRKQRVKEGGAYGSWREFLYGVLQGSILGPFLFNIFFCDLLYYLGGTDITSHADDTTPFNANLTREIVINNLENHLLFFSNGLITAT